MSIGAKLEIQINEVSHFTFSPFEIFASVMSTSPLDSLMVAVIIENLQIFVHHPSLGGGPFQTLISVLISCSMMSSSALLESGETIFVVVARDTGSSAMIAFLHCEVLRFL